MQAKLDSLNSSIAERNKKLQSVDTEIKQCQKEVETRKAKLEQEYEARRKQLDVKQKEVEEAAELKEKLRRDNLDIATLIKLVKEYSHGSATSRWTKT